MRRVSSACTKSIRETTNADYGIPGRMLPWGAVSLDIRRRHTKNRAEDKSGGVSWLL